MRVPNNEPDLREGRVQYVTTHIIEVNIVSFGSSFLRVKPGRKQSTVNIRAKHKWLHKHIQRTVCPAHSLTKRSNRKNTKRMRAEQGNRLTHFQRFLEVGRRFVVNYSVESSTLVYAQCQSVDDQKYNLKYQAKHLCTK